jgi:DNA-binding GntR family transcriptional regulator
MFEVMAELESMCGRLAARRMSVGEHKMLIKAHEDCEKARAAQDPDAYFYANEQFHAAIYAGSHNQFLSEQAQQLHRRLRPYRRLQLRVRDRMGSSYTEHAAIVQAITSGNPQDASVALHGHIVVQGERFGDLLASLGDLTASAA